MKIYSMLLALVAVSAPTLAGCANNDAPAVEGATDPLTTASDDDLKRELRDAIEGLETDGGEGEPDAYELTDVELARSEALTDDVLLQRLLPKLFGSGQADGVPGLDPRPISDAWARYTAEPSRADYEGAPDELEAAKQAAAKWRAVQELFDANLTEVRYVDLGYRASPTGSLETGPVAHVFVGRSSTGRVFAIWGIDIWT